MARPAGAKSPAPRASPPPGSSQKSKTKAPKRPDDYTSDGVEDNDVFLLPISDYQIMTALTIICAVVRLFRIYQPTSVVFDEVQYGVPLLFVSYRLYMS